MQSSLLLWIRRIAHNHTTASVPPSGELYFCHWVRPFLHRVYVCLSRVPICSPHQLTLGISRPEPEVHHRKFVFSGTPQQMQYIFFVFIYKPSTIQSSGILHCNISLIIMLHICDKYLIQHLQNFALLTNFAWKLKCIVKLWGENQPHHHLY